MPNFRPVKDNYREVIGLIPAGGRATRISPLPCSKELYPVGFHRLDQAGGLRPKVVCHYLLEKMRLADITKAYIVLRNGKWDIPAYLGDGKMFDMQFAYLMMDLPFGVPYTLDQAYTFVQDAIVTCGLPDIIFQPDDAFVRLLTRREETNADVVLGIFPTDKPHKWDMVDLDDNGRIRQLVIKPVQTHLRYAWAIAVWTPVFTDFMHNYLPAIEKLKEEENTENQSSDQRELFLGDVFQAAINNHLKLEAVLFPDYTCLDIGTGDDLLRVIHSMTLGGC